MNNIIKYRIPKSHKFVLVTSLNEFTFPLQCLQEFSNENLRKELQEKRRKGIIPHVMVTGYETYEFIIEIFSQYVRYMPLGLTHITIGINGLKIGEEGALVLDLYGMPIIPVINIPIDASGYERLYVLNFEDTGERKRLGVGMINPNTENETMYYIFGGITSCFVGAKNENL